MTGKSVLVVDDTNDNLILIGTLLRSAGLEVSTAANGIIALEMVKHKNFDLVVMDIQMPHLDGLEVTTILRMRGYDRPVIACTAFGNGGAFLQSESAKFDAYLAKPLMRADLLSCVEKLVMEANHDD